MVKFWTVLMDDTEYCRYKHPTLESARQEAEKLLRQLGNRGRDITILEAVEYGKAEWPPVRWERI